MFNLTKKQEVLEATGQVEVFSFSQEKSPVRVQLIKGEPWFVAKDVCEVLEHSNHRMAVKSLDEDEVSSVYLIDTMCRKQETTIVSESGLYSLIFQSRKAEAKKFRKWVTSEVLPSIRKKGLYVMPQSRGGYFDARDIPYSRVMYNGSEIRAIKIDDSTWYSINDVNTCIKASTESCQSVRRLNAKRTLTMKIWLYGATHPAWFTTELGVKLLLCASRNQPATRLALEFKCEED